MREKLTVNLTVLSRTKKRSSVSGTISKVIGSLDEYP